MKDFKIVGDTKLQLRLEAYNLFNHANLNDPNPSVGSADFGTIRGKYGDGRGSSWGSASCSSVRSRFRAGAIRSGPAVFPHLPTLSGVGLR